MLLALGFISNNAGWGTCVVDTPDMDDARAALTTAHGIDFVRVIILQAESPIGICGNWREELSLKNASLDTFAAIIDD